MPTPERIQQYATDPAAFRDDLIIDADAGPVRWADIMDDWQAADFAALDAGWQRTAHGGEPVEGEAMRSWRERPRGHSKSLDVAAMTLWAVLFAPRRISGIAAAADRDQAGILREKIGSVVQLNSWMNDLLDIQQWRVKNRHTGSSLDILASDSATSYGITPDFVVADEIVHWRSEGLWVSLLSAASKRASCRLDVITNAGFVNDWQWDLRESVRVDPDWHFSRLDGPQATWMTERRLAEQERLLPRVEYRRLFENAWVGEGDLFSAGQIDRAISTDISHLGHPKDGYAYALGIDIGLMRDRCALVLSCRDCRNDDGRYEFANAWTFTPTADEPVSIIEVERAIRDLHQVFRFSKCYGDPWQAAYLSERLQASGIPYEIYNLQSLAQWDILARHMISLFDQGQVLIWDHAELIAELRRTRVVGRKDGKLRLDWPRVGNSHGDISMAFAMSLLAAKNADAQTRPTFDPRDYGGIGRGVYGDLDEPVYRPGVAQRYSGTAGAWGRTYRGLKGVHF